MQSSPPAPPSAAPQARLVVPIKAFDRAKQRLSATLDPRSRAELAQMMAGRVVAAAGMLQVVIACDDDAVAEWAASVGAAVQWTPGADLNAAVQAAVERAAAEGVGRVVVAHADLPFAHALDSLATAATDEVILVSDRRASGTNVLSVPTRAGFVFQYGSDSATAHRIEAARVGLRCTTRSDPALEWDVDEPEDLDVPVEFGALGLVDLGIDPDAVWGLSLGTDREADLEAERRGAR